MAKICGAVTRQLCAASPDCLIKFCRNPKQRAWQTNCYRLSANTACDHLAEFMPIPTASMTVIGIIKAMDRLGMIKQYDEQARQIADLNQ